MKKGFLIIAIVLAGILALSFTGCSGGGIKMDKYISVAFTGTNGSGVAEVTVDFEQFEAEVIKQGELDINNSIEDVSKLLALEMGIGYTVTPDTGLSNGDKVVLECTIKPDAVETSGIKASGFSKTITVSGLN